MTEIVLPPSWIEVPLADVGNWVGGGTPSKGESRFWENGTIPWVSPKDMKQATLHGAEDSITEAAVAQSATQVVRPGSVLVVTRSGILRHTLPVATNAVAVAVNQDLKAITPYDGFDAAYIAWALRAFEGRILHECSKTGTTVQSIETSKLRSFKVPMAPPAEQRRIVAALEEHLSDLDAAVAGLERARTNTQRFLAALIEYRIAGISATANGEEKHLRELVEELDQGWSPRCDRNPASSVEWGVIKTTAVQPLSFQAKANKRLPMALNPRPGLTLRKGDLLITRAGPRSRVGISCVVPTDQPRLMNCDKVYRVNLRRSRVRPEYIAIVLNTPSYLRRLDKLKTGISDSGVNLTQDRFMDLALPVPSLAEQDALLADVAAHQSVISHTAAEIHTQLARAARLRQAILKRAFEGKLVPQDPNDEPASALIARIRGASNDTSAAATRLRRRGTRSTTNRERT